MKKKLLTSLVTIMMVIGLATVANAQDEEFKFYSAFGTGIAYNAPGKNISKKSFLLNLDAGCQYKFLEGGFKMRLHAPYSPTTRDSSWIENPSDSVSHWTPFYQKTANLLINVGVVGGDEVGFTGSVNTAFGIAFAENKNKLGTFPIFDFMLEGGYNISPSVSILLNCTYSYLWHLGDMLKEDGFSTFAGIKLKIKFPNEDSNSD